MSIPNVSVDLSVCLASYNGAAYISSQISSIVRSCNKIQDLSWELIVSDDYSTDNTLDIVKSVLPPNGTIVYGHKSGISKNFENAILNSNGKIIVLSDQDDVWEVDRISLILHKLSSNDLVVCNLKFVGHDLTPLGRLMWDKSVPKPSLLVSIFRNQFCGAAMAFKREVFDDAYPFPDGLLHDVWLGCVSLLLKRKVLFLYDSPILFRRHNANNSSAGSNLSFPTLSVFLNRFFLLINLVRVFLHKS